MIVTLPLPPSANLYWRIWRDRSGRIRPVTSPEARAYRQTAALAAKAQGMKPIATGDVSVTLLIHRPAKRGDIDNRLKVLLDALRGVAFRDDAQIRHLEATQLEDAENPRVEVTVTPFPGE